MPLTDNGDEIKKNMEKEYGADRGERVFYASANKGTIKGVHEARERFARNLKRRAGGK